MRRSTITATLMAGAALAAGCGTFGDESIVADDASAVTVAGADSAIAEEGDARPEGEADSTAVLSVTVDVPEGVELAGIAVVALEDITLQDAPAIEIARIELPATELATTGNTIELFLPLPLDGSLDITATAHIDVDENGSFSQGDWISPDLVPVTAGASNVTVTMVQI